MTYRFIASYKSRYNYNHSSLESLQKDLVKCITYTSRLIDLKFFKMEDDVRNQHIFVTDVHECKFWLGPVK